MADTVSIATGSGAVVATDEVTRGAVAQHVQFVKLMDGTEGSATQIALASDAVKNLKTALYDAAGNVLLPAAAALADGAANPTVTKIGALGHVYNGATWDLSRAASTAATALTAGVPAVAPHHFSAGSYYPHAAIMDLTDGNNGQYAVGHAPVLYNGATWDRARDNQALTVLASGARTTATQSANLVNHNGRGVIVTVDVTARTGATTLDLYVIGYDTLASRGFTIGRLTGINAGANANALLIVYPGAIHADLAAVAPVVAVKGVSAPVPRTFYVLVVPSDSDSVTYSVAASLLL